MRIIHTSDWHLGQHFMGRTREAEHRAFLDWLLGEIKAREADGLVVAGDIFDTGAPPSYARTLYNEFIVALQEAGCAQTLILGGNHDGAAVLNEGKSILAYLNTRVVAGMLEDPGDHVVVLRNRAGHPGLIVCAVPFLRPGDLIKSFGGQSGREKQAAMGKAIQDFYAGVADGARAKQAHLARENGPLPIMVTGHLTLVGGKSSESVRDIYIGSLDAFPAKGLPQADYVALGHLHRGQGVKGQDHIRYSGSPIPLSFDEGGRPKEVLQVDFEDGVLKEVISVPVPCFRPLKRVKGSLEEIEAGIRAIHDHLSESPSTGAALSPAWLEAEVTTDHYLSDLQDRIQAMIQEVFKESGGLELLRVRRGKKTGETGPVAQAIERLEELTPKEVFSRRLALEELEEEETAELHHMFDEIVNQIMEAGK